MKEGKGGNSIKYEIYLLTTNNTRGEIIKTHHQIRPAPSETL